MYVYLAGHVGVPDEVAEWIAVLGDGQDHLAAARKHMACGGEADAESAEGLGELPRLRDADSMLSLNASILAGGLLGGGVRLRACEMQTRRPTLK
jgi:hypothetical protein